MWEGRLRHAGGRLSHRNDGCHGFCLAPQDPLVRGCYTASETFLNLATFRAPGPAVLGEACMDQGKDEERGGDDDGGQSSDWS